MQRPEHASLRARTARPAVLALSAIAAAIALPSAPLSAQDSWEIDASIDGPKLVSMPLRTDPKDAGSPILVHRTYAYVVLSLTNSSSDPAPISLGVYSQEMAGDVAAGRARAALLASDAVLAAIREAEGDDEIADVYSSGAVLEGDSSVQLFAVVGRDFVPANAEGEPSRAFDFPAAADLIVRGLRFQLEDVDGTEVATVEDWVARIDYADDSFDTGSGEFREAGEDAGIPIGSSADSWSGEQVADYLQAWSLDVQAHRPRPVFVTEPPRSSSDLRTLNQRTRAFWYVRFRVTNASGDPRPLNLTAQLITRSSYEVDDLMLKELEDPSLNPIRRRIYEQQIRQKSYLPVRDAAAFRAAAAQEVERYGAVYGPIDFFALPSTIQTFDGGGEAMREMLRSEPVGAYDVIVLFTSKLDPSVTEFEFRLGGTRNQVAWLNPETRLPEGNFSDRKLYRIAENEAWRFQREGSDVILTDPFRLHSTRWIRLQADGGLRAIDLVQAAEGSGG